VTVTEAVPDVGNSRYGAIPRGLEAEGFPRHYPLVIVSALYRDGQGGLRRYERVFTRGHPRAGQIAYPTRNFAGSVT
jgi:hypothetical protein